MQDNSSLFVKVGDGARIAYRLEGPVEKPVLVLSNSIGTSMEMWDGQVKQLTEHFRVLRYDTRGHGASEVTDGAYSFDRLGRDVIEMLDALQIQKVDFMGLSLGGFIGQWLGVFAPDRIDRLVLCNTSPYLGPANQWDQRITEVLRAPDMKETAQMFLENWFPSSMLEAKAPVVEQFRSMLLATDPKGLAGAYAAVRDSDLRRIISLIPLPTLVISGKDDTVTAASHGEQIAATIPGAKFVVMPAVHMTNVECPMEFMNVVLEFLGTRAR